MIDLDDKSVVVVGNSGHLTNSNLGNTIDNFDTVIRFNEARTIGFEKDVGSRFDIWITYSDIPRRRYFEYLKSDKFAQEKRGEILDQIEELWYVSWNKTDLETKWKNNSLIKQYELMDCEKRIESIRNSRLCRKKLGCKQSTGINAIWCLSEILDKFYIIGFSAFGSHKDTNFVHYYDSESVEEWRNSFPVHTPKKEDAYLRKLKNNRKIIELEKDINPKNSELISNLNKIICDSCGKENIKYPWENQRVCQYCLNSINKKQ